MYVMVLNSVYYVYRILFPILKMESLFMPFSEQSFETGTPVLYEMWLRVSPGLTTQYLIFSISFIYSKFDAVSIRMEFQTLWVEKSTISFGFIGVPRYLNSKWR